MSPKLWILVLCALSVCSPLLASSAKITLKVVNEDGEPVTQFPVIAGFYAGGKADGKTDENGCFIIEGEANHWEAYWTLKKEGFYRSQAHYEFKGGLKNGRWEPWNPVVTTVVRRIINPIPMYIKRAEVLVPVENAPFSYDLVVGDLVQPYGNGQTRDMTFLVSRRITATDDYDGTLTLSFANAFDGIQEAQGMILESELDFPRLAPMEGYQPSYTYSHGKDPKRGYYGASVDDPQKYYLVRVRSEQDGDGRLTNSLYGTIRGQIELSGVASSNNVRILFHYVLNANPNDINLECDPKLSQFLGQ